MNLRQIELGERNRAAVRALMVTHLGISRVEIAAKLSLSPMAVTRHVTAIRSEWGGEALPTRRADRSPAVEGK
ncbi:biotin operon repressor [Aminobacter niigataensis]|uniref:Biotin operon repressor n=1 Tax=Aminobacter niigataensis TaxID=83265 RepID=A0ABR6L0R5_9HYPH|nr:hypothetical protein [Aminobacter niigataensis]MBB4649621.1 biotin operon repressor [Aminobacter niigataensis]